VEHIRDLAQRHIDTRSLGLFGEARVDVPRLNLAPQLAYRDR
jgi:K+-transporting ATPase c subunit